MAGSIADAFKGTCFGEQAQKVAKEKERVEANRIKANNAKLEKGGKKGIRDRNYPSEDTQLELATAPYNFIPLPDKAVASPLGVHLMGERTYGEYIKNEGRCTGYIDIVLTTKTPTCINWNSRFFAPKGLPTIPGSTLRGMIKNYLKIISCGTMRPGNNGDLTDRHLYFRDIASTCSLKDYYLDKVKKSESKETDNRDPVRSEPGFLVREKIDGEFRYRIYHAEEKWISYDKVKALGDAVDSDGEPLYECLTLVDKCGNEQYHDDGTPIKIYKFKIPEDCKGDKKGNVVFGNLFLNGSETSVFGAKCYTGDIGQYPGDKKFKDKWYYEGKTISKSNMKHHYYFIYNPDWTKPIDVPDELIRDYSDDKNHKGFKLLGEKKFGDNVAGWKDNTFLSGHNFEGVVPCFYMLDDKGNLQNFGYGKYYRIPYEKSIGEHIPQELQNEKIIDFADAMFGCKEVAKGNDCKDGFAGRVFFEDAVCMENKKLEDAAKPTPLMGPNPSSFQLYLEQHKGLSHWDDDTSIRGYKLYWHQDLDGDGWKLKGKPTNGDFEGNAPIQPVGKDVKFSGRIRFENLSDVELGALLKVLQLGQKGCFKIGAGKPLGMGSVSCSSVLHLIDNQARYKSLFVGDYWQLGENLSEQEQYIRKFDDYMEKAVKEQNIEKEHQHILKVLAIMMSWDKKPSDKRQIRYMSIGDDSKPYQNRFVLPTPEEVIGKKEKSP